MKTFIKEFIAWLKAIYTKPIAAVVPEANVAEQTIETTEDKPVSEPIVDVNPVAPVVEPTVAVGEQPAVVDPAPVAPVAPTPAEEVKAGVQDFEAALKFVESGVDQLGVAAKDELKLLAKKYL